MTTKIKILVATALIALSACNNDDNITPVAHFPADGVIRIVSDESLLQTRVSTDDRTTEHYYNFDLWIKPKGKIIDSKYIYNNIKMTKPNKPETVWKVNDGNKVTHMVWQDQTTPVEVMAICIPMQSIATLNPDSTFNNYVPDRQNELDQIYSDILFFKGVVNPTLLTDVKDAAENITEYALKDGSIRIPFRHVMSKLNVILTLGTDLNTTPGTAESPVTRLKVLGTNRAYILDAVSGSVKTNTARPVIDSVVLLHNPIDYTPGVGSTTNAVAKFYCILVPQTIAANNFFVRFSIDGKHYIWRNNAPVTLKGGEEYFLSINLSNETIASQKSTALRRGYDRAKDEPAYITLDGTFSSQPSQW